MRHKRRLEFAKLRNILLATVLITLKIIIVKQAQYVMGVNCEFCTSL